MAPASKPNPQIVRDDILKAIRKEGLSVYFVEPEMWPNDRSVWWDTNKVPDYEQFLLAAKSMGVRMMLFFDQELSETTIADAEDALELAVLEPEEFREYARRIADFRSYIGFTSRLGVGFASEGIFYWYDLEAPWYEELLAMMEDLHISDFPFDPNAEPEEDEGGEPPRGNFYSNN